MKNQAFAAHAAAAMALPAGRAGKIAAIRGRLCRGRIGFPLGGIRRMKMQGGIGDGQDIFPLGDNKEMFAVMPGFNL